MRHRIVMGFLALAACLPALAVAQQQPAAATTRVPSSNRGSGWELSVGGGGAYLAQALVSWIQSTNPAASRVALGGVVRLGYNFSDSWGLSVGTGVGRTSPAIVIQPLFAVTWTPNINSRTSPFLTTGFGASYTSWSTRSSDPAQCAGQSCKMTGLGWHLGFGIRQMVSENLALRVEARGQYERYDQKTSSHSVFNGIGGVGLSWFFGGGRNAVATLAVNPMMVILTSLGATQQVSASPTDRRGKPLAGRAVTWSSSNDSVATVSATGLVTARSNGSATITVASEGKTGTVGVEVAQAAATLVIAPASAALTAVGQTQQLTVIAQDANGNQVANPTVTWSSSDPTVASVNAAGLATANKNGSAEITAATDSGRAALATLNVAQMPASVAVTPSTATISAAGGTIIQFSAQAMDANGSPLVGRTIAWTSNAPGVATVSPTGLASAVGNGTAQISATVEDKTGSATLTVALPVRGVAAAPTVELPTTNARALVLNVIFHPNSARLPPEALAGLDSIASALRDIPNARWEISGYTSNMGDAARNLLLSRGRALAVKRYLVRQGVPAASLTSVGYGAAHPITSNATVAGRRQNMRVEVKRLR